MLGTQIDLETAVVWMAVVPGHKLRGSMRAAQVLARYTHALVSRVADRVADDVVALQQLPASDVATELDMAEETEPLMLGRLVVGPGDRLDLRMVRRHAAPHETVRGRQAIVQVNGEPRLVDRQELSRRVEAGRARADNCNAQRRIFDQIGSWIGIGGNGRTAQPGRIVRYVRTVCQLVGPALGAPDR
jgi:hypothetical protein